jgi:hypothetical protein
VPLGRSRVEEAAWRIIVAKYCATFPAKIWKDLQVIASNHVTAYFGDFFRCHIVGTFADDMSPRYNVSPIVGDNP